jgi:hypothetical protein
LPKPNKSAPDTIVFRTALLLQPLFIKFPFVADKAPKHALMPLFFVQFFFDKIHHYPKYKGIRARLWTLSATKGKHDKEGLP